MRLQLLRKKVERCASSYQVLGSVELGVKNSFTPCLYVTYRRLLYHFLRRRKNFDLMILDINPDVAGVIESYPKVPGQKLQQLRKLIIEIAEKTDGVDNLEETLRWREPRYLTKYGSTIRMDWKEKNRINMPFILNARLN